MYLGGFEGKTVKVGNTKSQNWICGGLEKGKVENPMSSRNSVMHIMGAYNLASVRMSVRGQRFLRSVWVNWFETLGQEQVRSEDYARQIDF